MKIIELIPSLSSGGAERFVVDLSNQLSRLKQDVVLFTTQASYVKKGLFYKRELEETVKYRDLQEGKFCFNGMIRTYKAIKAERPNIVHIHSTIMIMFCLFAILFYRDPIYIVTQHTIADNDKKTGGLKFLIKRILIKFKMFYIVSIGVDNSNSMKRIFNADTKLIVNGRKEIIPTDSFEKVKEECSNIRKNDSTKLFIHVARCSHVKNQLRLVRCFNELYKKNNNVKLLIIGTGFFDSELGKQIRTEAKEGIIFLGEKHNVGDYLLNCDYFCLSSDYEGMPISLIEAIACGCIPIGTPVSGFNDAITDGKTGFVSPDFTDESFISTMEKALNKYNEIDKELLKKEYHSHFSMEICAERYVDFFKTLSN